MGSFSSDEEGLSVSLVLQEKTFKPVGIKMLSMDRTDNIYSVEYLPLNFWLVFSGMSHHTHIHTRINISYKSIVCTLPGASLVGCSITVTTSIDVVRGKRALQRTGLLGVDLLWGGVWLTAGAGAATGVGRAIWQNRALGWRAGWTGATVTWILEK